MSKLLSWKNSNQQLLSKTAMLLISKNCSWRNDCLFDGDNYLIKDCIQYEYDELGNDDVLNFNQKFGIKTYSELFAAIKDFQASHHIPELFGWWITDKVSCQKYYQDDPSEQLSKYQLPQQDQENTLILSDLDCDGILIATPSPHENYEIR